MELFDLARSGVDRAGKGFNAVEIGSYLGASASFIAAGLAEGGRVLCIDTWTNNAMSEGQRDTMSSFLANTAHNREQIIPIRGWSTSPDVIARVASTADKIDLLFIDGDHSYEEVLQDWRAYAPMMAPGGVVAMHDVGWAEGVQQVIAEEIRPYVINERRFPNLWWGQLAP
ncbi:class I SAM-dependent methyltransferase [Thermomonas sp. HDW16]|uniref:class I SAM-dependent methyltransferase n=1 Tax=Thermomonas sp. HDW16 TaxID=2714945 RepID=UPI00140D3567|nr:class I SAM-dependent methyltransferase [Thermomonas sp. HDW16]QIL21422.1 class I SAM-dependent methyltransferase [Thermomonas sp. HDW16]